MPDTSTDTEVSEGLDADRELGRIAMNTEVLAPKQVEAIQQLLQHPRIIDAAQATGISQTTLWRWMQEPEFRAVYRAAQRQALEGTIAYLQHLSADAADALRRNLTCGRPAVEVQASTALMNFTMRGHEMLDLITRIEQLEASIKAQEERKEAS